MLAEWKRDPAALLRRIDLDKDGQIDLKEWELALHQAQREVESDQRELRSCEDNNFLLKPADGRLFLLSNYLPDRLQSSYTMWAWIHAIVCVTARVIAVALTERVEGKLRVTVFAPHR